MTTYEEIFGEVLVDDVHEESVPPSASKKDSLPKSCGAPDGNQRVHLSQIQKMKTVQQYLANPKMTDDEDAALVEAIRVHTEDDAEDTVDSAPHVQVSVSLKEARELFGSVCQGKNLCAGQPVQSFNTEVLRFG